METQTLTKDEYILWMSTRPENAGEWDHETCRKADLLIKITALGNLRKALKAYPEPIRDYIYLMASCNYGSAETDNFLMTMNAYPKWM